MSRMPLGRHGRLVLAAGGIAAAAAASALEPPPPGLADAAARNASRHAALVGAALTALAILPFVTRRRGPGRRMWIALAAAGIALGVASFAAAGWVQRTCTVTYAGNSVIAGTELTPLAERYLAANPDASRADLLFDARGTVEHVWTATSIERCRIAVAGTYALWIPLLVIGLLAAIGSVQAGPLSVAGGTPLPPAAVGLARPPRYDVFLSYRHGDPDARVARELLELLEADGYAVAIDERDFRANESFLDEMERCIRESRFTLAIVSGRYLESGNCREEAVISKVLDMEERKRRLVPFVIEPVSMPAWLYGIVGIFATKADPLVDPVEKLTATLGAPAARA